MSHLLGNFLCESICYSRLRTCPLQRMFCHIERSGSSGCWSSLSAMSSSYGCFPLTTWGYPRPVRWLGQLWRPRPQRRRRRGREKGEKRRRHRASQAQSWDQTSLKAAWATSQTTNHCGPSNGTQNGRKHASSNGCKPTTLRAWLAPKRWLAVPPKWTRLARPQRSTQPTGWDCRTKPYCCRIAKAKPLWGAA